MAMLYINDGWNMKVVCNMSMYIHAMRGTGFCHKGNKVLMRPFGTLLW